MSVVFSVVLSVFHAAQACLGAYTGLFSAMAIYNLQQREEQAESAAKYSNTAAHQLHKTRTTQTSGVVATICSTVSSLILTVGASSEGSKMPFLLSAATAAGITFAYRHIRNFWRTKARVPFFSDYNDGVRASQQMIQLLRALSISWGLATVVYLWQALVN